MNTRLCSSAAYIEKRLGAGAGPMSCPIKKTAYITQTFSGECKIVFTESHDNSEVAMLQRGSYGVYTGAPIGVSHY